MDGSERTEYRIQENTIESGQNITVYYTWGQSDMDDQHVYRREVGDCGRANLAAGGWQVVYSVR